MEILLHSKTCVFLEDMLITKQYSISVPYAQITQVIYEQRHKIYEVVYYNEKNKKRTVEVASSRDKENEEAIWAFLKEKVQNLEPRKAKRPIWKAGELWIALYILLAFIILLKFFLGPFEHVSVPLFLYPFFLLANLVPSETFSVEQLISFLLKSAGLTLILCFFSYVRSNIVIYEKKEP